MFAKALSKIYYHSKDTGFLGGVERILKRARQLHVLNVTRQTVQKYLKSEQTYTLHKPARRWFIRNHIYVAWMDAKWQADLAYMQAIVVQNGGMKYL